MKKSQTIDLLCRVLVKVDQLREEVERLRSEVKEKERRLRIRLTGCKRAKP